MANSGRFEGSRCNTGLCTTDEAHGCGTCTNDFYFQCGIYYWVTRSAGSKTGVVNYKLQLGTGSGYMRTYTLHTYDTKMNGYNFGYIPSPGSCTVGVWRDVAGVTASQTFTYNDDGTAPAVTINGGGAQFNCKPYCKNKSCYTTLGGCTVYPDRVTVDWKRKPGNLSGSVSSTTCTGATLRFNVGDPGVPSAVTTQIQYGTTTSYGQSTSSSSATSGTFTLSNLQAGTTYHYRIKTTNETGTSYSSDYTFKTKGTPPSAGNPVTSNPGAFQLSFNLPNIVWQGNDGCVTEYRNAVLTWKYVMDGRSYSFSQTWSGNDLGNSLSYDTGLDKDRIPDDETVTYTWTLTSNIGTVTKTGTIYCQPSYEAWVCGPSTNYQWVECELYASEKAGIASYKKVRRIESITS